MKPSKSQSLLKWPGGKEREIPLIFKALPKKMENYYEPFVGSGAVFLKMSANQYYINDKTRELIQIYHFLKNDTKRNIFIKELKKVDISWMKLRFFVQQEKENLKRIYANFKESLNTSLTKEQIKDFLLTNDCFFTQLFVLPFNISFENFNIELKTNLIRKIIRMQKIEAEKGQLPENDIIQNIESAIKSAFYMQMRYLFNNVDSLDFTDIEKTVLFFYIRSYAYSGMFRYNKSGEFNVPYGGIAYNEKSFEKKINFFKSSELIEKLQKTTLGNEDFYAFLKTYPPQKNDFIFFDPPYDTEFSTYATNEFNQGDQIRLANYLIHECKAQWMIIIKKTDFIYKLYDKKDLFVLSFDKTYQVSFMNRNNKNVKHLLITNYPI